MTPDSSTTARARPVNANEFIEQELDGRLREIENSFDADAITFSGPIIVGVDDALRGAIEAKRGMSSGRRRLAFFVTTLGGYIEIVQRIVQTMRKHYELVDFFIPNYAYSAGTVLAMSGDAIYMDYYSRLGPIDPQVETQGGRSVSAIGYLEQYQTIMKKAEAGKINAAEVQILLGFDQGELYSYEQAREHSVALLKEWLVKYKFKDWKITRDRQLPVTKEMKTETAARIAMDLNDTKKWHSHGHGIAMDVLQNDLNLLIDDFSADPKKGKLILDYHSLFTDYMARIGVEKSIHYTGKFERIV